MTGLLKLAVRKPSLVCANDRSVRPFSGYEGAPRVWPFNATEKLGPDISELLSMRCSWCVLDCGEAQIYFWRTTASPRWWEPHRSLEHPDCLCRLSRSCAGVISKTTPNP
jgi:hypothetical protein